MAETESRPTIRDQLVWLAREYCRMADEYIKDGERRLTHQPEKITPPREAAG
jgi:hypothetical protein